MGWNQFGDFIGAGLDLHPHSLNFVDQDPHTINPDPHHWKKKRIGLYLVNHVDGDEIVAVLEEEHVVVQDLVEQLYLEKSLISSCSMEHYFEKYTAVRRTQTKNFGLYLFVTMDAW